MSLLHGLKRNSHYFLQLSIAVEFHISVIKINPMYYMYFLSTDFAESIFQHYLIFLAELHLYHRTMLRLDALGMLQG